MPIKQKYYPYTEWEDFKAGMWNKVDKNTEEKMLQQAIEFTGDNVRYGKAMMRAVFEWPKTMEHNLTNKSINHCAFVGHCAVCIELGIPEYITRMAWGHLSNEQQNLANWRADSAIAAWKQKYIEKHKQIPLFK